MDVVIRVGHGAIAPCTGDTRYCGGVTDTRLMIPVIGAPESIELTEQIRLLVAVFRRAQPIHRIRSRRFADFQHFVADFLDRLVPGNLGPFAVDKLGWIFQAPFAMGVFTDRSPFRTMGTQIERAVEAGLLPDPNAVIHFSHHGAPNRTMRTDGFHHLHIAAGLAS